MGQTQIVLSFKFSRQVAHHIITQGEKCSMTHFSDHRTLVVVVVIIKRTHTHKPHGTRKPPGQLTQYHVLVVSFVIEF